MTRQTTNAVYVAGSAKRYHQATCRYVRGETTTEYTLSAAKAKGYQPCKVCKPPA